MIRSSLHVVFVAVTSVALFACGSSESTASTGTGGASATSASAATTSAGGGTSAGGSTSTGETTASSTSGSSSASSTGTGATPMNACTNAADTAALMASDVKAITTTCGQQNVGAEPATHDCIKMKAGLTEDCTTCYSNEVDCIADHCIVEGKCLTDPAAQLCTDCRKKYCTPAYEACSGLKSM